MGCVGLEREEAVKEKVVLLAIVVALLAWFFRYDFQVVTSGGQGNASTGYALNRITGTLYFVAPGFTRELKPATPLEKSFIPIDIDAPAKTQTDQPGGTLPK